MMLVLRVMLLLHGARTRIALRDTLHKVCGHVGWIECEERIRRTRERGHHWPSGISCRVSLVRMADAGPYKRWPPFVPRHIRPWTSAAHTIRGHGRREMA